METKKRVEEARARYVREERCVPHSAMEYSYALELYVSELENHIRNNDEFCAAWGLPTKEKPSPMTPKPTEVFDDDDEEEKIPQEQWKSFESTPGYYDMTLYPHPSRKEPLVKVTDGIAEGTTATVDKDALLVTKDLTEPSSLHGTTRVEVDVEPKPFIVAASVESREAFSGSGVEQSRGRHDSHYLTSLICEIEMAIVSEFKEREKAITSAIAGSINTVIAAANAERIRAVELFARRLRASI